MEIFSPQNQQRSLKFCLGLLRFFQNFLTKCQEVLCTSVLVAHFHLPFYIFSPIILRWCRLSADNWIKIHKSKVAFIMLTNVGRVRVDENINEKKRQFMPSETYYKPQNLDLLIARFESLFRKPYNLWVKI